MLARMRAYSVHALQMRTMDAEGLFTGEPPWEDPLSRDLEPGYAWGDPSGLCRDGYMGAKGANGEFLSCHLRIKVPSTWEKNTDTYLMILGTSLIAVCLVYCFIRRRLKLLAHKRKIERRRSRKSSMDSADGKGGAFAH